MLGRSAKQTKSRKRKRSIAQFREALNQATDRGVQKLDPKELNSLIVTKLESATSHAQKQDLIEFGRKWKLPGVEPTAPGFSAPTEALLGAGRGTTAKASMRATRNSMRLSSLMSLGESGQPLG
jgi:hypothetical protein